ncbi:hypothetical protein PT974_02771 [Cladobotryum mycophilum]|uniref:RNase MRP protein 1 RNA binding domain-containing protein n=1 Tax=Cladobotryum mycophilum TaxID=491253 RepID=A0ABR0T089_9HYPO
MKPSPSDTLSSLIPILDAFNHRHHNQHRSSHWWSIFRITRRAVRTLSSDLRSLAPTARPKRDSPSSTPLPSPPPSARWLDAHVVPRAYVAFTQLAADNQYAPLGLLLLTILARIHAVLTELLPDNPATLPLLSKPQALAAKAESSNEATSVLDRGVTVSREEVLGTQHPLRNVETVPLNPSWIS